MIILKVVTTQTDTSYLLPNERNVIVCSVGTKGTFDDFERTEKILKRV